jgi:ribosomal protein S18 acetylase RimI-like enzyme
LNSIRSGEGIGTQLLNAVATTARTTGCRRIHLFTTNDNINALRFYQKYGFQLVSFIKNGVNADREIKPEIPKISKSGIPISDYLELAMKV